jgi:hypothetical protein
MILSPSIVDVPCKSDDSEKDHRSFANVLDSSCADIEHIAEVLQSTQQLGSIQQGVDKHFYSNGSFNLVQLMLYVLHQTGPAHVFLSTYSIAEDSISTLRRYVDCGNILSIRFLIDNRVRSISPKPFAHLVTSFPDSYRCTSLHAKVALISNDKWHVSIVGSQNATHNPKLERGIIHTSSDIWNFDNRILNEAFERGTT